MRTRRTVPALLLSLLLLAPMAAAYEADLVPASSRPEAQEITGMVSILGGDGTIHVTISNVNDAAGNPLSGTLSVQLKLRVGGRRQHVTVPLVVDTGDGDAMMSLGLTAGAQVIVSEVQVRDADRRTLAMAGVVTVADTPAPTPTPPAADCPTALQSCQSDLDECNQELNDCESGN